MMRLSSVIPSLSVIPISDERQEAMLRKQIDDLEIAIQSARYEQDGGRYTVKQIEKTRKTLMTRLEKLNQKEKKDNVVTFEELGVDHLYVDEAHSYKNAFLLYKNEKCSRNCPERSTEISRYV